MVSRRKRCVRCRKKRTKKRYQKGGGKKWGMVGDAATGFGNAFASIFRNK